MTLRSSLILTVLVSLSLLTFFALPLDIQAQANCDPKKTLCNPLGGGQDMSIKTLFEKVLDAVLQVGAVLAVLVIIYSGFLFVTSGGNSEKISKAKNTLLYAAIGIAILFGAKVIVSIVTSTLKNVQNGAQ